MGENTDHNNEFISTINSSTFISLTDENQKAVINQFNKGKEKEGGILGKFFGTKKKNAAMNIAFTICAMLIILCMLDIVRAICNGESSYTELVKGVLPLITASMGYIFGKSNE